MKYKISNVTQKWVDVLKPFSGNYYGKFSASELAEKSGVPQQSCSRILNKLSEMKLINYELNGKNKLFYLDLERENSLGLLSIVENEKGIDFNLNNFEVGSLIMKILKYCSSVIVFGSYASYKNKKGSDLDLIILDCKNRKKVNELIDMFLVEVNAHFFSFEKFDLLLEEGEFLGREVYKNHILFGDVSKMVLVFMEGKKWLR